MFGYVLSKVVCQMVGTLYPGYKSFKAIKTRDIKEYQRWMKYWTVMAFFLILETLMDFFVYWLPFYYEMKIIFILYLILPQFQGSDMIFKHFLLPTLQTHESKVDDFLDKMGQHAKEQSASLGVRLWQHLTGFLGEALAQGKAVVAGDDNDDDTDDGSLRHHAPSLDESAKAATAREGLHRRGGEGAASQE